MGATGYADIARSAKALERIADALERGARVEEALRCIANEDVPGVDFCEEGDAISAFARLSLAGVRVRSGG